MYRYLVILAMLFSSTRSCATIDTVHVLFIGNSLTYSNDLPGLFVKKAAGKGVMVKTEMIAHANYALEDHWNDGYIHQRMEDQRFDFVIVQQGPSSQPEGRQMLLDYGAKFKTLCDQYKAKLVFFMVWPALPNIRMIDGVIKNYTDAAVDTRSILCPVGEAWKNFVVEKNDISYYGADGFHPSEKGSQLSAGMLVETLFGK